MTPRFLPTIAFALGALLLAWPWMGYGYLFAADEYLHGYNACILDDLLFGGDSLGYGEWLRLNPWPEPNLVGHLLLLAVTQVASVTWAEKLIVVALATLIGYAFLRPGDPLVVGDDDGREPAGAAYWRAGLGLLTLTFLFGSVLKYGFVNYLIGVAALFAGLTATGTRPAASARWDISAWALLLYFSHPIALVMFVGLTSLRALLHRGLLTTYLVPRRGGWRRFGVDGLRWFGVPLALLLAHVSRQSELASLGHGSLRRLGGLLLSHRDLVIFSGEETPFAIAAVVLAAAVSSLALRWLLRVRGARMTIAVVGAAALAVTLVAVPDVLSGGAYIYQRLRPFVAAWVLWVAARAPVAAWAADVSRDTASRSRLGVAASALATLVAGGLTLARTPAAADIAAEFDELRVFSEVIPPGSVVLPASPPQLVNGREDFSSPFHHFAAVLGCRRGIVLLDNYEASVGYFPLVWRAGRDPFAAMTRGAEAHPVHIPEGGADYFRRHTDFVLSRGGLAETIGEQTAAWMAPGLSHVGKSAGGRYELYAVDRP